MSEFSTFSKEKSYGDPRMKNILKNIAYARGWYKKLSIPKNVKFKLYSSGSAHVGTVKDAILSISFDPPIGIIWPNLSIPISTFQDDLEFRAELNTAFEKISNHINEMNDKIEKGKLKPVSNIAKKAPNFVSNCLKWTTLSGYSPLEK